MAPITTILGKYTPVIEQALQAALTDTPEFLGNVIRYHFGWVDQNFAPAQADTGKRLRPVLCLLVFEALTGEVAPALPAAISLEMIHNFTLLHDDIEDNDRERRGRPTVWAVWGQPLAINVGDYLYTLAFKTLYQLDADAFPPARLFAVQRLIANACLELTTGQDLDLRFERLQNVTPAMYLDMVFKKTGALLEAAVLAGATLATDQPDVLENYRQFADNIGIAFQIRDDILGIWGDSARTGKSADNDLRRKKKTLPVLYTLEQAAAPRRQQLQALYASEQPLAAAEIAFVRECLEETGARQYAQHTADGYIEKAFAALHRLNISNQPQTDLETIARFLIDRAY